MSKLKYFLFGLRKQKVKAFLVFISTFLTLLTFNMSTSFQKSVIDTRMSDLRLLTQNTQITVTALDGSFGYFDANILERIGEHENVDQVLKRAITYVNTNLTDTMLYLYGMDVYEQRKVFDFNYVSGNGDNMERNDVLIAADFATEHGLIVGDSFHINSESKQEEMKIKAICKPEGVFKENKNVVISSLDFVQGFIDEEKQINKIDISIKKLDQVDRTVQDLNGYLDDSGLIARQKYDMSYFNAFVSTVVLAINIFSIFLILISVFIVYSVFQSYVYENIDEMATLRSIGFTRTGYRIGICLQALVIVVIALLVAWACTPFLIKLLARMLTQQDVMVKIHWKETVIKNILVFLIVFIGIWSATRKVTKLSITDVIKGVDAKIQIPHTKKISIMAAFIIFSLSMITRFIGVNSQNVTFYYVALVSLVISFLVGQYGFINLYASTIKGLFSQRRAALGFFGKHIKSSLISYLQAITGFSFVVSISLVLFSMSAMLQTALSNVYQNADIYLTVYHMDYSKFTDILDDEESVENYVLQKRKDLSVDNKQITLSGVNTNLGDDQLYNVILNNGDSDLFGKLRANNHIIITDTLSKNLRVDIGDNLRINNIDYIVIDIVKSFENMGGVAYISEDTFDSNYDNYDYCTILIQVKSQHPSVVKDKLFDEMKRTGNFGLSTLEEMNRDNNRSNQAIVNALLGFSFIIALISSISLFSVVVINILSRLREFLVYRTIGISKKDICKVVLFDSISISIYSILCGLLLQALLMPIIVDILSYYVGTMEGLISYNSVIVMFILSFVLILSVMLGMVKKYVFDPNLIHRVRDY